jgi:3-deoxy-manno-octulosonate cytidylyltransferase (CMP-KDO synthetase)
MNPDFHIVIPARYQSTRLPGKLLMDIGGKTVLERVYLQALKANPQSIVIATDSEKIIDLAQNWQANVILTAPHHMSGTDRIAEVISKGSYAADDIIVNVQGDEPFMEPALIKQVAQILQQSEAPMATLCWPIESLEDFHNPNVVKVVRNRFNQALYFSREPIPCYRDQRGSMVSAFKHLGIFAYQAAFLLEFVNWPTAELERIECLEQLRVLYAGHKIQVEEACLPPSQDINTEEDLQAARLLV